jgi:hypothetical protein
LVIEELHMDGVTEDKTFGPSYGEFFTGGGGDVEAMALAVPTDALAGPVPADLTAAHDGALTVLRAARAGTWPAASAALPAVADGWRRYRTGPVPAMIASRLDNALARLDKAVAARNADRTRQAAIDVVRSILDLELRYRPVIAIDRGRFRLWLEQLQLDARARDVGAMYGDFLGLDYSRERFLHTLSTADAADINLQLEELLSAIADEDFRATSEIAAQLQATIDGLPAVD